MAHIDERRRLIAEEPDGQMSSRSGSNFNWKTKFSQGTILVTVALERLAFYSIPGNLVLFLNTPPFNWESYNTMNALFFLFGIYSFFALIGGWLADTVLGRFKTIVLGFLIYLTGYVFFPLLSKHHGLEDTVRNKSIWKLPSMCGKIKDFGDAKDQQLSMDPFDEHCAWLIYIALTIMAVGTGTVKANIAPFGADQVHAENQQTILSFFDWFYWSSNFGSLVALAVITYVQQQWNFYYGYLAAIICLGAAVVVFCMGTCTYTSNPAAGSVLSNLFKVMKEAVKMWHRRSKYYSRIPRIGSEMNAGDSMHVTTNPTFLDYAKVRYGGSFRDSLVDDVKKLWKVFCVFLSLVPYWIVYYQMETTFLIQGLHMKLFFADDQKRELFCYNLTLPQTASTGNKPQPLQWAHGLFAFGPMVQLKTLFVVPLFLRQKPPPAVSFSWLFTELSVVMSLTASIPLGMWWLHRLSLLFYNTQPHPPLIVAAWFSLFDIIFLMVLIPFVDRVLYPRLARAGYPFTIVKRISVGMLFATLAVFIAGLVEMLRLKSVYADSPGPCCSYIIPQNISGIIYNAAPMTIFWQVPQYALIGISEVFAIVAGLEFAYQVAPKSMKGIIMGLFYLFSGVGSFVGTGLIYTFKNVFFSSGHQGDINCRCIGGSKDLSCHLDYYFFLLAGIGLLGFFIFLLVAKSFHLNQYSVPAHDVPVQQQTQQNPKRASTTSVNIGSRYNRTADRFTSTDADS